MRRKSFLVASLLAIAALLAFSARASADPIMVTDPPLGSDSCANYDFGDVTIGQTAETIIRVTNVGGHPLTISALFFMDGSDPAFQFVEPVATPFYVPAPDPFDPNANTRNIRIRFTPMAEGYVTAVVVFSGNDPMNCPAFVTVGGTGIPPAPPTDEIEGIEISTGFIVGNVRYGVQFIGCAHGDLPGTWGLTLRYTPKAPVPNRQNTILGGAWALTVWENGRVKGTLYGDILKGGTVTWHDGTAWGDVLADFQVKGGTKAFAGKTGLIKFSGTLSHQQLIPRITGTLVVESLSP